jgi:hypothetical protein
MVMIDLGHEKESLGVISVTHVTETPRADVALRVAPDAYRRPEGLTAKSGQFAASKSLACWGNEDVTGPSRTDRAAGRSNQR